MKFKPKDKVKLTASEEGPEVTGTIMTITGVPYMEGIYNIRLIGDTRDYGTHVWDVEVTEEYTKPYVDGLYVIANDQDDEFLTEYIVLRREHGEWLNLSGQGKPTDNAERFLENVKAGKHKMVRLVKEA